MQKSFRDQLAHTTGRNFMGQKVFNQPRYAYEEKMKLATRWQGDCIDHVNISKDAKSELGRVLEPNFRLRFVHDVFGELNSISELWSMLDTYVGQRSTSLPDVELKFILADAFWQRLNQFPDIAEKLKTETRPFDMYRFNDSGFPNRTSISRWWLEVVNVCRNALVNGMEYPNFKSLVEGKEKRRREILTYFLGQYIPNRKDTQIKSEGRIDGEDAPTSEEPKKPEPSLIQTVRSKPPVLSKFKPFLKPLAPKTGAVLDPDALRITPKKDSTSLKADEKNEVPTAPLHIGEGVEANPESFTLNLGDVVVSGHAPLLGETITIAQGDNIKIEAPKLGSPEIDETVFTTANTGVVEEVIPPVEPKVDTPAPVVQNQPSGDDFKQKMLDAFAKVFEQKTGLTLEHFGITPEVSVLEVPELREMKFTMKLDAFAAGTTGAFDPTQANQQTFDGFAETATDLLLKEIKEKVNEAISKGQTTEEASKSTVQFFGLTSAEDTKAWWERVSFQLKMLGATVGQSAQEFGNPYADQTVVLGVSPVKPQDEDSKFEEEVSQFALDRLTDIVYAHDKTPEQAAAAIADYVQKETQFVQNNELGVALDLEFENGLAFTISVISDKGEKAVEVTLKTNT